MEETSVTIPSSLDVKQATVEEQGTGHSYWPVLDFETLPRLQYHLNYQFYPSYSESIQQNNFFKGLKWSPDGSCFLTSSEDNGLRRFDLPSDAAEEVSEVDLTTHLQDSLEASVTIQEGEAVYDYCWYSRMSSADPGSCVFATTSRDHPVHLWDAVTGELRCTYRAYDAMDEIASAYSICFNPTGTKLYAGYKKMLRVFNTSRPGREFSQHSTLLDTKDGQAGIISCLAFSPNNEGLLAAGSYNNTTALYSEDSLEMLFVLHGQRGGVTQVMFSKDGNFLYTGARKDPDILCWDIRNTVGTLYKLPRITGETNQRVTFDIEPNGRYLGTGGQDGYVHIYDLQTGTWVNSFQAALDTVNSFGFHPYLPIAASASGHRRYSISVDDEGNDEDDDDEDEESNDVYFQRHLKVKENCASVWRFACSWLGPESLACDEEYSAVKEGKPEDPVLNLMEEESTQNSYNA